ncbi:MAG TPA: hypothetical protein VFY84_04785, partial [Jiangellales bacterium]|nr:hypothetical protein [Jiangellales bacterium]
MRRRSRQPRAAHLLVDGGGRAGAVVAEDRLLDLGPGLLGRMVEHRDLRSADETSGREGCGEPADPRVLVGDVGR